MAHLSDIRENTHAGAESGEHDKGIYRRFLKRLFDLAIIMLATPFVLPVVALLALAVRLDGGSAFYSQYRIGRNGELFRVWKLRSMIEDADKAFEAYLSVTPAARQEWSANQKLKNDPRVTPIGRFLRKTSLDELPQLWNVVCGEMSLVGPRPMLPVQADLYPGRAYYSMRPGLTGFWQISSRNETSFAGRAGYDTLYSERMSFTTDVFVLIMTAGVVLRGTGY